jgi:hypothetical protein
LLRRNEDVDGRDKPGHDVEIAPCLLDSLRVARRLPQALAAQAILGLIARHRQAGTFLGAPARSRQAAGEFRSASGTGEAPGRRHF